jgi:photoactive yellow protein
MPEQSVSLRPPPEVEPSGEVELATLDARPDATLDALPFGVIVLDPAGVIHRYNEAEARLARLDRRSVLGRRFFSDVAPCTATPGFQGKFDAYVEAGSRHVERFDYLFDFRFGAQRVDVELTAGSTPGRWVLAINRRGFFEPRAEAEHPAPAQTELEPEERTRGVRRDEDEQRVVQVPAAFFRAMRTTWDRIAPRGWPLFTAEWGFQWGRVLTVDLEAEMLQEAGADEAPRGLRDATMGEALGLLRERLMLEGWGAQRADLSRARDEGVVVLHLERSAIAEAAGASEHPRCHLIAGVHTAFFSYLAERVVAVREVCCASQGHAECSFVVVDGSRRKALERAIEVSGHDLAGTLAVLRSR